MMRVYTAALAFVLAIVASPLSAVILTLDTVPPLPAATMPDFFRFDNAELPISGGARASALFAGQGWRYTAKAPGEYTPWESPFDDPTLGASLSLMGQYPPPAIPPKASPAVDVALFQNVAALNDKGIPVFGGLVGLGIDSAFYGVTSILFETDINTFTVQVIGSGIDPNDGLGGPLWFAFFDRLGHRLDCAQCYFAKSTDVMRGFQSTATDIAGVQIWHEDPRGLTFMTLRFGEVVPIPATPALMLIGLAVLGRARRAFSRS